MPPSTCARCEAAKILTPLDWHVLEFYGRVATQYTNQTPMGVEKGPPVLTPRLEGIHAALLIYRYPPEQWRWLADWGAFLIRAAHNLEDFRLEKPFRLITMDDVL